MDDSTRFLIAQQIANTKYTADVRPLLELGKNPKTFNIDGAANFDQVYLQESYTMRDETDAEHIRHIGLVGDGKNNRVERFNGVVCQREKVTRTLKRAGSPVLAG